MRNVEKWLHDNKYDLPDDVNKYPKEAVIPYYKALEWQAHSEYKLVGPIIVFPSPETPFWQKVILTMPIERKFSGTLDFSFENAEKMINEMYDGIDKISSIIRICINSAEGADSSLMYDNAVVLDEANKYITNLSVIFDHFLDKAIRRSS